ncbi:hypothetical protein [Deinococcus alpinitundrae]|uniref:hypothetical protein n=1 Tax=Deinococcus alpinitundrae TaxID=468913 RepID=UPI0013798934|nr:hypothetical protein [Deinococcus alpinitundrae]
MAPKDTSPTRTVKAALGQPDSENGWQVGPFLIPYLSFSQRELDDLLDVDVAREEVQSLPSDTKARDFAQQLRVVRQFASETYARLFARRMGSEAPTKEQVYDELSEEDLSAWRVRTANGGQDPKAQAVPAASATGPISPPSSPT